MEFFLEKSCISHIFLAHCLFVLVSMETIMQNMEKENTEKIISSETICSVKLRLYRNIRHIRFIRFCVFYENQLFSLIAMATWIFHTFIMS